MITECCGRSIEPEDRYCPRCGWECRIDAEWQLFEWMSQHLAKGLPIDRSYLNNPDRQRLLRLKRESEAVRREGAQT